MNCSNCLQPLTVRLHVPKRPPICAPCYVALVVAPAAPTRTRTPAAGTAAGLTTANAAA